MKTGAGGRAERPAAARPPGARNKKMIAARRALYVKLPDLVTGARGARDIHGQCDNEPARYWRLCT